MLITRYVKVEGESYPVTISDEQEALLTAHAAGRAIVGIWRPGEAGGAGRCGAGPDGYSLCLYLVEDPAGADGKLLEKAVRRNLGLPLVIGETERLLIREFTRTDPLEEVPSEPGRSLSPVFTDRELRDAYIAYQYRFCECGLWALAEKSGGTLVGKAGVTDGELGYHVYAPFRGKGYAGEACRKILSYAREELGLDKIYLRVEERNLPSCALAGKLGFVRVSESGGLLLYEKSLTREKATVSAAQLLDRKSRSGGIGYPSDVKMGGEQVS